MSPVQTTTRNVGRWLDERDKTNTWLIRRLAEQGRWDIAEAIFREDAPSLLCGSSPRLRPVTR